MPKAPKSRPSKDAMPAGRMVKRTSNRIARSAILEVAPSEGSLSKMTKYTTLIDGECKIASIGDCVELCHTSGTGRWFGLVCDIRVRGVISSCTEVDVNLALDTIWVTIRYFWSKAHIQDDDISFPPKLNLMGDGEHLLSTKEEVLSSSEILGPAKLVNVYPISTTYLDKVDGWYRWELRNHEPKRPRAARPVNGQELVVRVGYIETCQALSCQLEKYWDLSEVQRLCYTCSIWFHFKCLSVGTNGLCPATADVQGDLCEWPAIRGGIFGVCGTAPLLSTLLIDHPGDWKAKIEQIVDRPGIINDFIAMPEFQAQAMVELICPKCNEMI